MIWSARRAMAGLPWVRSRNSRAGPSAPASSSSSQPSAPAGEAALNLKAAINDVERRLIREALDRIENGTYGTCEVCGEQISEERLKARPVTTQCIECKTDMEDQERRMAG